MKPENSLGLFTTILITVTNMRAWCNKNEHMKPENGLGLFITIFDAALVGYIPCVEVQ